MKIYRPLHILFGIIFFVGSYFAHSIYGSSTIVLGILIFIGVANIFYAFSDPKEDPPESKHPPGKIFYEASKQYLKDSKKANMEESLKDQVLMCPKCKVEEKLFNLAKRKNSQLMIYNENKPRIRAKDGLNIYPMICFNCKTISEFASDPYDSSGNSINGIEYFKSIKLNKKHISEALSYLKKMGNKTLIQKIKNL
jgi:hypothetical protein